jgi:hypothetical protein
MIALPAFLTYSVRSDEGMNTEQQNNIGNQTISVELTINEALSLMGVRFHQNHRLEVDALQKIKRTLEDKLLLAQQYLQ